MADPRPNGPFYSYACLAVLLGAIIYGGPTLFGQADPPEPAQEPQELVVQVRIEGNLTVAETKILPHVRTRAGRPLDLEMIEEDVRRLNRTKMFVDVKTFTQRVPGGRVVVFKLIERPLLQDVKYVGNKKVKTKVLKKETGLEVGDAADPFAVEDGRRKIEDFYKSRGFSKVHVTVKEGNQSGDRRAVYLINEGVKQRVLWTRFVGNTIATDARLRTQIKSKPGILWVFKGEVDRKQIDEDVNRLVAYYRSLGFFRARVGRELDFNASGDWLSLTFVIDEGPRYKVREVSFVGNTKFLTEELARKLKLAGGQYFNQTSMNRDVATIQDKYGAIGYIFADVKTDRRLLEEPGQLDLVYNIQEGARYRVGRINVEIKGEYPHTKIPAVLNQLSLKPGDIVDIRKLRASERRLRASGLFEINMQQGTAPKIVFSPPELDDEQTEVARPPQRRPAARGQSPDVVPCAGWQMVPAADSHPGNRRIDLVLPCRRVPNQPPPPGARYPQYEPPALPARPAARAPAMVVRGQYTPEAGWHIPQLPAWQARPTEQRASGGEAPIYRPSSPDHAVMPGYSGPAMPQPPPDRLAAVPIPLPESPGFLSEESPLFGGPASGDPLRDLDLDVRVQETQTGRLMFGVGVNSDAGLVGNVVIDERNFDWTRFPRSFEDVRNATAWRGAGQRLRLEAMPGTLVQRYMINFQEPHLFYSNVSLGLSGFYYDRLYREWNEQRLGGRISWGYQFSPDLTGSFSFRGAKINIYDPVVVGVPELDEVEGDNSLYGFRLQLAHDTRDSAFLATEGHLIEVAFEQVVGSFVYPRGEVDVRKYFLMHERPDSSGRHVLSLSARMGLTGDDTPIYEHYYAGGYSTIRGFDFRGASPISGGILAGGHFQLLASMQYMFPITADDMLRAVVFCDTGTVEPSIDDWSHNYRVAPGFGLRIMIPAMGPAPIAFDFAFPISSERFDRTEVFSFFVGFNH